MKSYNQTCYERDWQQDAINYSVYQIAHIYS